MRTVGQLKAALDRIPDDADLNAILYVSEPISLDAYDQMELRFDRVESVSRNRWGNDEEDVETETTIRLEVKRQ